MRIFCPSQRVLVYRCGMISDWLVRTFTLFGFTLQNWMLLLAAFALLSLAFAFLAEPHH